jgi:Tol biopolymer transport system component
MEREKIMKKIIVIFVCLLLIATVFGAAFTVMAGKGGKPGGGGKEKTPADPAIAYSHRRSVYVMNIDGTNKAPVYEGNSQIWQKSWSGDGTKIAFRKTKEGGNTLDLWVVDVSVVNGVPQGSNARFLREDGMHPSWSPTDDVIACAEGGGQYIRTVSAVDGTLIDTIYTPPEGKTVHSPVWSPDGERIAFIELGSGSDYNIMMLDMDTTIVTSTLVQNWLFVGRLDYANEHNLLAFRGGPDIDSPGMYTFDLDTGEITMILDRYADYQTWIHDDSELVFTSEGWIYSLDIDTGGKNRIGKYSPWLDARPTDAPW